MLHVVSEKAQGIRDAGPAFVAEQRKQRVAQGSEGLGGVAGAELGGILAQGNISDVVEAIFNGPVPAPELLDCVWVRAVCEQCR